MTLYYRQNSAGRAVFAIDVVAVAAADGGTNVVVTIRSIGAERGDSGWLTGKMRHLDEGSAEALRIAFSTTEQLGHEIDKDEFDRMSERYLRDHRGRTTKKPESRK